MLNYLRNVGNMRDRDVEKIITELTLKNRRLMASREAEMKFRDVAALEANSTYSIDEFLQKIFPFLLDIMDASRGSIALRSQELFANGSQFYIATQIGIPEDNIETRCIGLDDGQYLRQAVDLGKPMLITDINANYGNSSIVVPFGWDGRHEGAVCVSSKEKYSQQDVQLLSGCVKDIEILARQILEKGISQQIYIACTEAKDPYTALHSVRVAEVSRLIAAEYGMSFCQQSIFRTYGALHDIGKIGIPDAILFKRGKLDNSEFEIIKSHPLRGEQMLVKDGHFSPYGKAIVRNHQEKLNGNGYPDHLAGENIPEAARIAAVADAFDAMNSERCYRARLDMKEIIQRLEDEKGQQFDPNILQVFLKVLPSIVYTQARRNDSGILFHTPFCEFAQHIPRNEFAVGKKEDVKKLENYSPCPECCE